MKSRFASNSPLWGVVVILCLSLWASGAWAEDVANTRVVIDLSEEMLLFAKFVVWAGAIFLVILAGLGVMFFGFDVRKARAELMETTKEVKALSAEVRAEHANLIKMKDEMLVTKGELEKSAAESTQNVTAMQAGLENTIAAMEKKIGEAEKNLTDIVNEAERRLEELGAHIESVVDQAPLFPVSPTKGGPLGLKRSVEDLIRDVIKSGSFDWTTMDRLTKKTGLDRDAILTTTQHMPEVEISMGKKTQDHIFKLKNS